MAHISFFITDFSGGGVERQMSYMANAINERGHDVSFVVLRNEGSAKGLLHKSINVIDLRAPNIAKALPGLIGHIRRDQPAALFSAMPKPNIAACMAKCFATVPLRLITGDRTPPSTGLATNGSLKKRILLSLARRLYPAANAHIAVSQGVAQEVHEYLGAPAEKIHTIYNSAWPADTASGPIHPWLKDNQGSVAVAAGRLSPVKDYPTMLRSILIAKNQGLGLRLVICGEGPKRSELEALVRTLGLEEQVAFAGYVQNAKAYIAAADLFVLSSLAEGMANVLVEALEMGTPIASVDCPHGPREILDNGRYGELAEISNPESLALAMQNALKAGPPSNKSLAMARFDHEEAVDSYLRLAID